PLELLAEEEEQLLPVLVETGQPDGPADRVARVIARSLRLGNPAAVVYPRVGVPRATPPIPVARAVKVARAALGHHLQLAADGTAGLRLIRVREGLELGDGIDVRGRHVATVGARVDVADSVDRDVVGVRPRTVHGEAIGRPNLAAT